MALRGDRKGPVAALLLAKRCENPGNIALRRG